jgi:potassium-dependent mechanosensitive channel
LRVFIRRADYMLVVKSDLLFSINKKFIELGIEIPFPQSVVHFPNTNQTSNDKKAELPAS